MEIAVTGATGFIGAALVRKHLERGDSVRILVRKPPAGGPETTAARVFHGDLTRPDTLPEDFLARADVLYHCAAEVSRENLMPAVNAEGTRHLAALANGRVAHWVQVSTVAVYGAAREGVITEESALSPASSYGSTKAEAERIVAAAAKDFTFSVLRLSNVFGPGMRTSSLHRLIDAVDRGWFAFIGSVGAGANYVHVDNVVEALVRCATMPAARGRAYNVSDHCTFEHFIAVIAEELGKPPPRARIPEIVARSISVLARIFPFYPLTSSRVDAQTARVRYATDRIESELGYRHVMPIDVGLRELVSEWKRKAGQ